MVFGVDQLHNVVIEAKQRIGQAVLHIVVSRIDVIPLTIHFHGSPHMAVPVNATRLQAGSLKKLDIGGVVPLAGDRHARQGAIDAQIAERVVVADVVDNPIVERKGRFVIVLVAIGQARVDNLARLGVGIDEAVSRHIDIDGEPLVQLSDRLHQKLILVTTRADKFVTQHIGILRGIERSERRIVHIGAIFGNKSLLILVGARRTALNADGEFRWHPGLRPGIRDEYPPPLGVDSTHLRLDRNYVGISYGS